MLVPPSIRSSPADDVLKKITRLIESGEIKIGSLLPPERQLAVQLGVSRVVIREAAKKLEQRGIVTIHHGIGIRVANDHSFPLQQTLSVMLPENRERLRQCAEARLLIEPELAASAAQHVTPEKIQRLNTIHETFLTESPVEIAVRRDIEFHDAIAEMAGNKVLALMLQSVTELGRLSRELTLSTFGVSRAQEHHSKILAAITAGNADAARKAMKSHLAFALKDLRD